LREAQANGELAGEHDPEVLGPFLINAWEGVVTRTKVCKSTQAMDGFFAVFDQLFG
jgi:TetR/AcrR family transcriptional repressor of nem operon